MPDDAQFLKEQAERCRWLASNSIDPDIVRKLRSMAAEYEARARELEQLSSTSEAIDE